MNDQQLNALSLPQCNRLKEFYSIGPAHRAALEEFVDSIASPVPEVQFCNWTQPRYDDAECNSWQADCGEYWAITEGKPSENNMKFCHGCGKLLVEHPYAETGEEK